MTSPLSYTVSDAPDDLPVTDKEIRNHLRLQHTDQTQLLRTYAYAAVSEVESRTHRQLMKATYNLYLDGFPSGEIRLPRSPLLSVGTISYVDGNGTTQTDLVEDTEYTVDTDSTPGRIYLAYNQTWPTTRSQRKAVTIPFTCGYSSSSTVATQQAAVPQTLKSAVLLIIEGLFDGPDRRAQLEAPIRACIAPEFIPYALPAVLT